MSEAGFVCIGQVAECFSGYPFESKEFCPPGEGEARVFRGDNLKEGCSEWGAKEKRWKAISPELEKYQLKQNDVLVGMDGSKVGKNWTRVDKGDLPALLGQRVCRIRAGEFADQDFIFHVFGSYDFKSYVECVKTGTSIPHISNNQIRDFGVFLPPLPEQKKIAEILSGIDQTITKLDSQKTKYDRLFASMLSEVFADLHKSHEIRRIGEICEVKRGASPRPIQSKKWWGDGRGWTRISDVTKSKKYLYKTKDRLSPEGEQRSVPINPGSIILSICATIGLPVIPKIPVCIHDGFVWFEGIEKEILPEFAYYFFLSVRDGLVSGRQTGTQGNLNTSIVSQQLIPIPPQSEQKRIIKLMSDMEFQAEKIDRKIQSHKNLKSSLSSDLLSGRKRVTI